MSLFNVLLLIIDLSFESCLSRLISDSLLNQRLFRLQLGDFGLFRLNSEVSLQFLDLRIDFILALFFTIVVEFISLAEELRRLRYSARNGNRYLLHNLLFGLISLCH